MVAEMMKSYRDSNTLQAVEAIADQMMVCIQIQPSG